MTAGNDQLRFRQPTVKRLGLEDGWWYFCTHFLNLGLPLVFVDACLLPEAEHLGLENFGTRRPNIPLPSVDLRVGLSGNGVSLYGTGPGSRPVASHWFRELNLPLAVQVSSVGIIVGDSHALQLTWSALWNCRIGSAQMVQSKPEEAA